MKVQTAYAAWLRLVTLPVREPLLSTLVPVALTFLVFFTRLYSRCAGYALEPKMAASDTLLFAINGSPP